MKIMAGVLLANLLTAMFLYGMFKARNLKSWDDAAVEVLIAGIVPLGILLLSLFAYG